MILIINLTMNLILRLTWNLAINNLLTNLRNEAVFNNNKSLIKCVNHALIGFYLCQSGMHKCSELNNA